MNQEVLVVDLLVLGNHLAGQGDVVAEEGIHGPADGALCHTGHQDQLLFDRLQFVVEVPSWGRHPNRPVM